MEEEGIVIAVAELLQLLSSSMMAQELQPPLSLGVMALVEQVLRFELVGTNLNLRSPNLRRQQGATIVVGLQHYVGM